MESRLPFLLMVSQLNETCHVCAFSSSDEEEYRVLLPFIKGGIQYGDKAVHVVSPEQRQDHLRRLGCSGNRNGSGPATANSSFGPIPKYLREGVDCTFRRLHRVP